MIKLLREQKAYFDGGALRSVETRKALLLLIEKTVRDHEQEWINALHADLRKPETEAYSGEVAFIYQEIRHTLKHLDRWAKVSKVSTPMPLWPGTSYILQEGRGVNLIISPWNYPMMLLLAPLISCLAAGNTAVLMPSDQAPATSALAERLIANYFDPKVVLTACGPGAEVFQQLTSDFRFDFIFFTGSIPVGRAIAKQAAEQLIPVVLELGGKSPCLVLDDAHVKVTAKRIAWGKFYNAGQTCVSPDYVLVDDRLKEELIEEIGNQVELFYGSKPKASHDYGRIINERQFQRLIGYLDQGKVRFGGSYDPVERFISPTLMEPDLPGNGLMNDEIFGPILPVIGMANEKQMLEFVAQHPNPLSCYVYSSNKQRAMKLMEQIPFGGGIINHHLLHLANPDMPFGGLAASGMGRYHGKFGFDAFTHFKSVMYYPGTWDLPFMYPPYTTLKNRLMRWILS